MKVKSEITVTNKFGTYTLKFDGEERVTSCMSMSITRRMPLDICVGDYVEHDGVLCRVIRSNSEEYDEAETNPDHAIRDSLPKSEAAST